MPAGLARVSRGERERGQVRRGIGARHLVLHDAGVGEPDVRRPVFWRMLQDALEHVARASDAVAFEGFERRPPFDERTMRRQQRIEPGVAFLRRLSRDGRPEPVAAPWHRLDEGGVPGRRAEQPAQARDRLFDAVVADGDVLPAGLQQIVLRDNLAGPRHQQQEDVELPVRHRDRFAGGSQPPARRIELETVEDEAHARRHDGIVAI